jgi:hypothetical protein
MIIRIALLGAALSAGAALFAQNQAVYTGAVVTGQLQLLRTTNVSRIPLTLTFQAAPSGFLPAGPEKPRLQPRFPPPPAIARSSGILTTGHLTSANLTSAQMLVQSLSVSSAASNIGFNGMTHSDQRLANSGNQFSIEPPNPSIAVANGNILEGVNNAVRVYTTSGAQLIPTIASNQLFGLGPAIDRTRTPNVYGVYTTDMRVFFDQDISRWFVLQRSQDEDSSGNPLSDSHIYLAVSQTGDPTGTYNIYVMDTSNGGNVGCPCVDDYPQIGADRYGFYISANEYSIQDPNNPYFNGAVVLAISKADLAAGNPTPKASRFAVPYFTGYEFAIQPASTPPGASPFLASGGVEFFVSSYPVGYDNNLALWALSNTASLQTSNPNLLLTRTTVSTLAHVVPPYGVSQRSGNLTLGSTLEFLDAGYFSDSRVLSVSYSGGRLFVTLASAVLDANNNQVAGCLYVVFAPTFRGGVLGATSPDKQGYLAATNNHILRPAIAVNPQGRGAIAFTLVGPDYYPSAAFVSIDITASAPSAIEIVGAGVLPEDGFSGYGPIPACPTCSGNGIARWGDYSTAVTSTDGSIWLVSEYIPNLPRTPLANWGTFISQYLP